MKMIASVALTLSVVLSPSLVQAQKFDEKIRVKPEATTPIVLEDRDMCVKKDREQYQSAQNGSELYFAYRHSLAFAKFLAEKYPTSELAYGLTRTRSCIQVKQLLSQYYQSDLQYIYHWNMDSALKAYHNSGEFELYNYMMSPSQYEEVQERLVAYLQKHEYEVLASSLRYEHAGLRQILLMAYFQSPDVKPSLPDTDANALESRIFADYYNLLTFDME